MKQKKNINFCAFSLILIPHVEPWINHVEAEEIDGKPVSITNIRFPSNNC